jgi:hypothetical protein
VTFAEGHGRVSRRGWRVSSCLEEGMAGSGGKHVYPIARQRQVKRARILTGALLVACFEQIYLADTHRLNLIDYAANYRGHGAG